MDLPAPAHLKWARRRFEIQTTTHCGAWLDKTSSQSLIQNGLPEADVAAEQQSIVMARVAPMLRLPDNAEMLQQLRALFRQDIDFGEKGLSEGVAEFCSCITVIVNHQDVESFMEFLEVLGVAV